MGARLAAQEILDRLVALDTTSRLSNRALVDFVADYLDDPETSVETSDAAGKLNLVARRGPAAAGSADGLVLCGHTDTVPADEPGWSHDPFTLSDGGDRWYGRGTADMKGFLALAVERFALTAAAQLTSPLVLLFTCDEEIGSLGARRFAEDAGRAAALPRSVLVGEPTELAAVRLHKGHLRGRITFRGVGAHSGYPHRGINAVTAAARAVVALAELQRRLERERLPAAEHFPEVPFEVINPAVVHGGSAVNVVPDLCRLDFGVRLLPGSDPDHLVDRMRAEIEAADLEAEWEIEVSSVSPPLETAAEAVLHRELCSQLGQETSRAVSFSSDAGVLAAHGFDCVLFGPGSIEVAHKPDEHLPKAEFAAAARTLERLVDRFCRSEP